MTMKKIKLLFLTSLIALFTACGPTTERRIDTTRGFDMWDYMTASVDVEAEYDVYENGRIEEYRYIETHRLFNDRYERESSSGLTTLFANSSNILMREPDQDVTIERYLYLGDRGIFHAPSIDLCTLEKFYYEYRQRGQIFNNVIMVDCISKSGVNQQYYYGYNEGLVAIYENDRGYEKEWIKIRERRI